MFGEPGRGDRIARRILLPLLVLFVTVTALFYVIFDHLQVVGPSMEPTLLEGDRVLITKGYETATRGDIVVVLGRPRGGGPEEQFIKRIVAVEGDTIEVVRGTAYINGSPEPSGYDLYLSEGDVSVEPSVVPEGHVFVMGDNRPLSWDSRFYGPSSLRAVHGRVVVRYAPIFRIGRVD